MAEDVGAQAVAQLLSFAVAVAANLTSDNAGRVTQWIRTRGHKKPTPDRQQAANALNFSLQSRLQGEGLPQWMCAYAARFILERADLAYIFRLWRLSRQPNGADASFRRELRAQLILDGGLVTEGGMSAKAVKADDEDLTTLVAVLSDLVAEVADKLDANTMEERAPRSSSTGGPMDTAERERQFAALGQPDLGAFISYSERYSSALRRRFRAAPQQHLVAVDGRHTPFEMAYIEPDVYRVQSWQADSLAQPLRGERTSLLESLGSSRLTVLVGPAGAGKSTLLQQTTLLISSENQADQLLPVFVELRQHPGLLSSGGLLRDVIKSTVRYTAQSEPPSDWVDYMLLTGRLVVFLDGFDEILSSGDRVELRKIIDQFAAVYSSCPIVITSRVIGYQLAPFDHRDYIPIVLDEFDDDKVREYAEEWFRRKGDATAQNLRALVPSFLAQSQDRASDLRANPLMLSLLCAIYYERRDIPRTLADIYERCADLMFQTWNTSRGVEDHGAWSQELRPALYWLAYTISTSSDYRAGGIPESKLIEMLSEYWANDPAVSWWEAGENARSLVGIWAGRAWIITSVGSDLGNNPRFGFVHRTFLEYFTAMYVVSVSDSAAVLCSHIYGSLVFENGWSAAQLAISVFAVQRRDGGARVALELISMSAVVPTSVRVTLLRFVCSLAAFVRFRWDVLDALGKGIAEIAAASIVTPEASSYWTVAVSARRSRAIRAEFQQLSRSYELRQHQPSGNEASRINRAELWETNLQEVLPPSSYDVDELVRDFVDAIRIASAPGEYVLSKVEGWFARGDPERAFLATVWWQERGLLNSSSQNEIGQLLADAYSRCSVESSSWLVHVAAYSRGISSGSYHSDAVPWNVWVEGCVLIPCANEPVRVVGRLPQDLGSVISLEAIDSPSILDSLGRAVRRALDDVDTWPTVDWSHSVDYFSDVLPNTHGLDEAALQDWPSERSLGAISVAALWLTLHGDLHGEALRQGDSLLSRMYKAMHLRSELPESFLRAVRSSREFLLSWQLGRLQLVSPVAGLQSQSARSRTWRVNPSTEPWQSMRHGVL